MTASWRVREIADPGDAALAPFMRLTDVELRRTFEPEHGIFIAEGHLVIERAVDAGLEIVCVLTSRRWLDRLGDQLGSWDGEVLVADEALLMDITGFRVHRGALAVVRRPRQTDVASLLASSGPILVLEELVDATNVGLAIRSAAALGVRRVLLSPGCADPLYRRAVKASMATVFTVSWARSDDWASDLELLIDQRDLIGLTPSADDTIDTVLRGRNPERVALMMGSEGPGISHEALRHCTVRARIPMHDGVDSLNVAAATAVACYALDVERRSR